MFLYLLSFYEFGVNNKQQWIMHIFFSWYLFSHASISNENMFKKERVEWSNKMTPFRR